MVFIFFTGAKEPSSWFAAQELGLGGTVEPLEVDATRSPSLVVSPGGASRRTSEGQVDTFRVRDHSKLWALSDELAWNHVSRFVVWQLGPCCFIFTPQKPDRHNSWRKRIRSSSKRQGDTKCAHQMQQILIQSYSIPLYIPYHTLYTAPSIDLFLHYLDGLLKSYEIYRNKTMEESCSRWTSEMLW